MGRDDHVLKKKLFNLFLESILAMIKLSTDDQRVQEDQKVVKWIMPILARLVACRTAGELD